MKRFCLAVFLCLVLFSGQAAAVIAPVADTVVGQFGGTAGGAVSFNQQANLGEFFLHTGEPFVFSNSGFDLNETHQFRYDWQTSAIEPSLGDMNSGSVYWTGTLQNFLDRQYSATLVIGGTQIPFTEFYRENGDGHVFVGDFGREGQVNPVALSVSQVSLVPIPGAVWLFGSALAGFAGFRKRFSKA